MIRSRLLLRYLPIGITPSRRSINKISSRVSKSPPVSGYAQVQQIGLGAQARH